MKKIIVAPLNWGLGHATRCIPIINTLIKEGFEPIIASDGDALLLLQKEFPKLKSITLPGYPIDYSKRSSFLKLHLALKIPQFLKAVKAEKKAINKIIIDEQIQGIISDNRFGVRHKAVPSIYITHQINVLSGITSFITSMVHRQIIKKFDACWVPDDKASPLSGKLSKAKIKSVKTHYIGILSRFKNTKPQKKLYDHLIILSGPEPQRSQLESLLLKVFKGTSKKVLLIQGKLAKQQKTGIQNGIKIVNYMTGQNLQKTMAQSELIIARSGYSTIMDLAVMNKRAFFIPTPGQTEHIYLAKRLAQKNAAPYALQHRFKITDLDRVKEFEGLKYLVQKNDTLVEAFKIFK